MNYLQISFFGLFVASVFVVGIRLHTILDLNDPLSRNRAVCIAECLLLGSIIVVGELLLLSLVKLYKAPFLWGAIFCNYGLLLSPKVRTELRRRYIRLPSLTPVNVAFALMIGFFILRNFYFLVDVDSLSTYLYAQKLWLAHGSSIFADKGLDIRIFAPHFDAVPYALGLSIFESETLFCQLVNIFWRTIAVFFVFGYTAWRFNPFYGLAAAMMLFFNDHFFYSGMNSSVTINGALISLLFASTYNFWEARENPKRFFLSLLFLSQLMANKYQMLYFTLFILTLGLFVQRQPLICFKEFRRDSRWLMLGVLFFLIGGLWYMKNFLATGLPTFPILAGRFHMMGWTPEMESVFMRVFRGLTAFEVLKYCTYLFVWPGIHPAKVMAVAICSFPIILFLSLLRNPIKDLPLLELCWWLANSLLAIVGIGLSAYYDPRYYRYPLGIFSFAAILWSHYTLRYVMLARHPFFLGAAIILLSLSGAKVGTLSGGSLKVPTLSENLGVLTNHIHFSDAMMKFYPHIPKILQSFYEQKERTLNAAWGIGPGVNLPSFLLPNRPLVSLWLTTIIKWDSYKNVDLIAKDLKDYGLEWIMSVGEDRIIFLSPEEYAKSAVEYDRRPKSIYYAYDLPPELKKTKL